MENCVRQYLTSKGYSISDVPYAVINMCDTWYRNECDPDFHRRKTVQGIDYEMQRLGFGKRVCSDDANLCEVLEINPGQKAEEFITSTLRDNNFLVKYREQLEQCSAEGTTGAYIAIENADVLEDDTLLNGKLSIVYCNAAGIVPLTVQDGIVTECAFSGTNIATGKKVVYLTIFTLENGEYVSENTKFDERGNITDTFSVQLGNVKPFSILRNAEVNNIRHMDGFGYPKLYSAIPALRAVDLAWNVFDGDLDKSDKLLLVNELLCSFDADGKPITPNDQAKKVFCMVGRERLPDEKQLVQEYNPTIRVDDVTKALELALSMLSMKFGFGNKRYTFEQGQIKTATEYIGARQDAMQELNKQRGCAETYIRELCNALVWFSNHFFGTDYLIDDLQIQFDDSYIEDKASKLESMRADAVSFQDIPILKVWYLMEKYNLDEEEATKYVQQGISGDGFTEEPED